MFPNYPYNNVPNAYGIPNYPQQPVQSTQAQIPQGQTIKNINQQATEPQVSCYFVKSAKDLNALKIFSDMSYIGINRDSKEVYIRKMNDKGVAELETYVFNGEKTEETELQKINRRLDTIEKMLTAKGAENGYANANTSANTTNTAATAN